MLIWIWIAVGVCWGYSAATALHSSTSWNSCWEPFQLRQIRLATGAPRNMKFTLPFWVNLDSYLNISLMHDIWLTLNLCHSYGNMPLGVYLTGNKIFTMEHFVLVNTINKFTPEYTDFCIKIRYHDFSTLFLFLGCIQCPN